MHDFCDTVNDKSEHNCRPLNTITLSQNVILCCLHFLSLTFFTLVNFFVSNMYATSTKTQKHSLCGKPWPPILGCQKPSEKKLKFVSVNTSYRYIENFGWKHPNGSLMDI